MLELSFLLFELKTNSFQTSLGFFTFCLKNSHDLFQAWRFRVFNQDAAWAHNQDYFCSFLFKKVLKTDAKLDPNQETAHGLHLMQNKNGRGRTILDLET